MPDGRRSSEQGLLLFLGIGGDAEMDNHILHIMLIPVFERLRKKEKSEEGE